MAFAPFRLDPPRPVANGARMRAGVLEVDGRAVARSPRSPDWLGEVQRSDEFVVDVTARSLDPDQGGPARIVAIEESHTQADLVIGQQGADLLVRFRRPGSNAGGNPPLQVPDIFADDVWHRVTVAASDGQLVVSVDGVPQVREDLPAGGVAGWNPGYRLFVGDAAKGDRAWHGEVRALEAGSGRTLVDYLDRGALEIPDRFWYVPERLRDPIGWDAADSARFWQLSLGRFATFVPVGVLAMAAAKGRSRRVVLAIGVAAMLTTTIQVGKVFFSGRHPALTDLVIELAGSVLGVAGMGLVGTARSAPRRPSRRRLTLPSGEA